MPTAAACRRTRFATPVPRSVITSGPYGADTPPGNRLCRDELPAGATEDARMRKTPRLREGLPRIPCIPRCIPGLGEAGGVQWRRAPLRTVSRCFSKCPREESNLRRQVEEWRPGVRARSAKFVLPPSRQQPRRPFLRGHSSWLDGSRGPICGPSESSEELAYAKLSVRAAGEPEGRLATCTGLTPDARRSRNPRRPGPGPADPARRGRSRRRTRFAGPARRRER
jgi:hypothetical protein